MLVLAILRFKMESEKDWNCAWFDFDYLGLEWEFDGMSRRCEKVDGVTGGICGDFLDIKVRMKGWEPQNPWNFFPFSKVQKNAVAIVDSLDGPWILEVLENFLKNLEKLDLSKKLISSTKRFLQISKIPQNSKIPRKSRTLHKLRNSQELKTLQQQVPKKKSQDSWKIQKSRISRLLRKFSTKTLEKKLENPRKLQKHLSICFQKGGSLSRITFHLQIYLHNK